MKFATALTTLASIAAVSAANLNLTFTSPANGSCFAPGGLIAFAWNYTESTGDNATNSTLVVSNTANALFTNTGFSGTYFNLTSYNTTTLNESQSKSYGWIANGLVGPGQYVVNFFTHGATSDEIGNIVGPYFNISTSCPTNATNATSSVSLMTTAQASAATSTSVIVTAVATNAPSASTTATAQSGAAKSSTYGAAGAALAAVAGVAAFIL